MNTSFWKDKRVLITGHSGFKGGWLTTFLRMLNAKVVGYSLSPPSEPNLFQAAEISDGIISCVGDIRDLSNFTEFLSSHEPQIIIHMAAQSLVSNSYEDPVETFTTNVLGTVNVLESVRSCPSVKVVLIVTSDKCYDNKEWIWGYRENDPLGGQDPYSSSKGCAELVTSAYRSSFFKNKDGNNQTCIATARAGNVIGGGDWAKDRLIPDVVTSIINRNPLKVRNPNALRPWQHVLEPLYGYLTLIEHLWINEKDYSGGWNFGPDDNSAKPVSWLIDQIYAFWGDRDHPEIKSVKSLPEAQLLKLDSSKARYNLGWHPKLDLETALEWTVNWYKKFYGGEKMRRHTEEEIGKYIQKGAQ